MRAVASKAGLVIQQTNRALERAIAFSQRVWVQHPMLSAGCQRRFATQSRLMTRRSINKLASDAHANTFKYLEYLQSHGLPLPSHDAVPSNGLPANTTLPEDIIQARDVAINDCQELSVLLGGPARSIVSGASEVRVTRSRD